MTQMRLLAMIDASARGAAVCPLGAGVSIHRRLVINTPLSLAAGVRRPARRLLALAGLIWTGLLLVSGAVHAAAQSTVELPVAFQVKNTDTSQAPCDSGLPDGATYTIEGHISGPQVALASGK